MTTKVIIINHCSLSAKRTRMCKKAHTASGTQSLAYEKYKFNFSRNVAHFEKLLLPLDEPDTDGEEPGNKGLQINALKRVSRFEIQS